MTPLDRDASGADALLTDLYLDALLAGAIRDLSGEAPGIGGDRLDPALARAAERLRHDLVRVHPSFRFEERLARRLAEAALGQRVAVAVGEGRRVVPFPRDAPAHDDLAAELLGLHPAIRRDLGRPLLIGGALTSAALSIAGAAFVAWRFGRPGRSATPMARAARAVRGARVATGGGVASVDPLGIGRRVH